MSFEIQELPDVIGIFALLSLSGGRPLDRSLLKRQIDKYYAGKVCVGIRDIEETLREMSNEGLIFGERGKFKLTSPR